MDQRIPVQANAGLDQKTVADAPTVFKVGRDFVVVLLVQRSGRERGVAGAGKILVLSGAGTEGETG